ncbi:helix-turn-helix domain-containing protein [Ulvibacterium sp.]|uniref:helix-turn-helix domain-containing protein n=1 Tax=Ulvibacterium sp. TaxID=2665914 RepID=UPI003BAD0267
MKKKINLVDSGVGDIIASMANSLETPFNKSRNEYYLELPEPFGTGFLYGHSYDHGFGVVDAIYRLKKDFHFELDKGMVHPLKIIFNMGDDYQYKLEHQPEYSDIRNLETMIVASTPKNNHRFLIPSNSNTSIFSLEINRKLFETRIKSHLDALDMELEDIFRDVNGVLPFFFKTNMSYEISNMIEEFRNCSSIGLARSIYLEAKAYEILASFIQLYLDDIRKVNDRRIFRHNHLQAIKNAADYIKDHMDSPITISVLARKHGLGTSILQNGFRTVYGMSVNEFIRNERLLLAKQLLEEGQLSISQITYAVGLNSKSYLSKIFAERYGMAPSLYREKYLKRSGTQ